EARDIERSLGHHAREQAAYGGELLNQPVVKLEALNAERDIPRERRTGGVRDAPERAAEIRYRGPPITPPQGEQHRCSLHLAFHFAGFHAASLKRTVDVRQGPSGSSRGACRD